MYFNKNEFQFYLKCKVKMTTPISFYIFKGIQNRNEQYNSLKSHVYQIEELFNDKMTNEIVEKNQSIIQWLENNRKASIKEIKYKHSEYDTFIRENLLVKV